MRNRNVVNRTVINRIVAFTAASALLLVPLAVAAPASAAGVLNSGFEQPFAGDEKYLPFAPKEVKRARQVNAPLGQERADALAARLGFDKKKAFSKKQYASFIAAQGKPRGYTRAEARKAAELVNASVVYLTNTTGNTYNRTIDGVQTEIVLGSYGLVVNQDGLLESPANASAPTRIVNWVLAPNEICRFPEMKPPPGVPCGYMGSWMRSNGARDTLKELYSSAYPVEVVYGNRSQGSSEPWELVQNTRPDGSTATVGMAMAPSIWIVNFLLIYALNPTAAAEMPMRWAEIPAEVADALYASETGQVPFADYQQYFN